MPRIRTFKPEFFRSPDTAKASPLARLLFMAMWSWADDEGIGETNLYGLRGFAFPDTDDLTAAEIPTLLAEIGGSFGVVFYEHRGRHFYAIPTWSEHQRTERGTKSKRPRHDDPDSMPDQRFNVAAETGGNPALPVGKTYLGTGEQGNRGTGEQLVEASRVRHQSAPHVAPAEKCSRHRNDPNPPDCGGCAAARRAHTAWARERQLAEADELERKRSQREANAVAVAGCNHCDSVGWSLADDGSPAEPATKCPHPAPPPQPHTERAARAKPGGKATPPGSVQ